MPRCLHLKISLRDIKPPIWRRIVVPADSSFLDLHEILQIVMGWENYHLWEFWEATRRPGALRLGPPLSEEEADSWMADMAPQDAGKTRLEEVFTTPKQKLFYTYDMGDNWEHELLLEAIEETSDSEAPRCLTGRRACPPEDCGSIPGYYDLLELLKGKAPLPDWFDGLQDYDPEAFSVEEVNRRLAGK